jgi:hypothetical protein
VVAEAVTGVELSSSGVAAALSATQMAMIKLCGQCRDLGAGP